MLRNKVRIYYILSLLALASLIVLFAQGIFSGMITESGKTLTEINRIDLFDNFRGNYSKISVMLANNDTISHNFSIDTYYNENLEDSYNVSIDSGMTFTYQRDVLPTEIPISQNETINSTLRVAKFVVYMDDKPEPFEEARFVFKNE
jgi:hypothetical protein